MYILDCNLPLISTGFKKGDIKFDLFEHWEWEERVVNKEKKKQQKKNICQHTMTIPLCRPTETIFVSIHYGEHIKYQYSK